jgi:hypothetical protein
MSAARFHDDDCENADCLGHILIHGMRERDFAAHLEKTARQFLQLWSVANEALRSNEHEDVTTLVFTCEDIAENLDAIGRAVPKRKR